MKIEVVRMLKNRQNAADLHRHNNTSRVAVVDDARWTRNCRIYSVKCVFYLIKSIHECFCHFLWAALSVPTEFDENFIDFLCLSIDRAEPTAARQQSADTDGRAQVLLHKKSALELCARIVSMESKCFMALGQPKKLHSFFLSFPSRD